MNPLIDSSQTETFIQYAHRKFPVQVQKKHLSKKQVSVDVLTKFSLKKIGSPLHAFDSRDTQRIALDIYDKIMQYMGDVKKPEKDDTDSILQSLIDLLIKHPELGNEGFAQLIKQMTNNPRPYVFIQYNMIDLLIKHIVKVLKEDGTLWLDSLILFHQLENQYLLFQIG